MKKNFLSYTSGKVLKSLSLKNFLAEKTEPILNIGYSPGSKIKFFNFFR